MWMVCFFLSFLRVSGGNSVLCLSCGADSRGLVEIRHAYSFLHSYLRCGGLVELQKRIVVSASGSALWAVSEVLAKKQKRIMRFCTGICVMVQFQGFIRKTDTHLPHRYLCCGVVAEGCAELHRRIVVSA